MVNVLKKVGATGAFVAALGLSIASFSASTPAHAETGNLFTSLNGNWRGGGTVSPLGGDKERVACRVKYNVRGSGAQVSQSINCTGTGYRVSATSNFRIKRGRISGSFTENGYGVNGSVSGRARGKRASVRLKSNQFSGGLSIRVSNSRRHSVTITQYDSVRGKYVPIASIRLRRR